MREKKSREGREERSREDHEERSREPRRAEHSREHRKDHEKREEPRRRPARSPKADAREVARSAAHHVQLLTGKDPEVVTSLERREDGWLVGIEVVETHRIPESTDILAEYRVQLDDQGDLVSYRRSQRYSRGRAEEGE
ncbi:gas vesicle protein [Streptomyces sporangiiformans]|uniref:Gas vesicle protein n=1 Tax=Streptomyces sporangiiformans TaxID=2315329 RepID=A0A505D438_9ACTN|nr:gas vesicle protein [Streptomyces sporangiiformans]